MKEYDSFVSYAKEDETYATELVGGLKSRGYRIWYAPLLLKIGDTLLDKINAGIKKSNSCILLLSDDYLKKGWTSYELDTLMRYHIEQKMNVYPILHGITVEQIREKHPGLSGIICSNSDIGIRPIVNELSEVLSKNAATTGIIPYYESPTFRFLQGLGEIILSSQNGQATTLWEFLLYSKDSDFPLFLNGGLYTKEDLLYQAASLINHIPHEVEKWVGKEGRLRIIKICTNSGYDPNELS